VTGLIDAIRSHVMALPDLTKFAVVVAAIVGLLLFGVALGPHVLGFFGEHRPIANFFAKLGKPRCPLCASSHLFCSFYLPIDFDCPRLDCRDQVASDGYGVVGVLEAAQ